MHIGERKVLMRNGTKTSSRSEDRARNINGSSLITRITGREMRQGRHLLRKKRNIVMSLLTPDPELPKSSTKAGSAFPSTTITNLSPRKPKYYAKRASMNSPTISHNSCPRTIEECLWIVALSANSIIIS